MEGSPVRIGTEPRDSMAMPADMDMSSDDNNSSEASDTTIKATTDYLMLMPPHPEMAIERLLPEARPGMEKSAMPDRSRTVSSCTHETCSQISASTSPPTPQHPGHDALCSVASIASSLLNVRTDFHWIRPGTPPPLSATADQLATILRV